LFLLSFVKPAFHRERLRVQLLGNFIERLSFGPHLPCALLSATVSPGTASVATVLLFSTGDRRRQHERPVTFDTLSELLVAYDGLLKLNPKGAQQVFRYERPAEVRFLPRWGGAVDPSAAGSFPAQGEMRGRVLGDAFIDDVREIKPRGEKFV